MKFNWLLIFIVFTAFGLAESRIYEHQTMNDFNKNQILQDESYEYCDPNNDSECEIIIDENNPCDIKYDQCINQCKSEDCLEKCDVEYEACLDSL